MKKNNTSVQRATAVAQQKQVSRKQKNTDPNIRENREEPQKYGRDDSWHKWTSRIWLQTKKSQRRLSGHNKWNDEGNIYLGIERSGEKETFIPISF